MKPEWLDTSEYPFTSRYIEIDNQKMHYIDEGEGPVVLFVHGTPSWSFDFRKIIKGLSKNFRCIAMDHIGFGLSEKSNNYEYTTQKHAHNLQVFISRMKISNFTMVVHDFGGPIGLNYALKYPDEVARLVIMNTWLWSSENDPDFKKFSRILKSPLLPFLYLYLNFSARFLLPGSFGKNKLAKGLLKNYTKPFSSKNERYGPLSFAKSLLNDQAWFEQLWMQKDTISDKPVLFVWGMKDKLIGTKYLEKFESAFRNSNSLRLEETGHFPQEENHEEIISAMKEFMVEPSIKFHKV